MLDEYRSAVKPIPNQHKPSQAIAIMKGNTSKQCQRIISSLFALENGIIEVLPYRVPGVLFHIVTLVNALK